MRKSILTTLVLGAALTTIGCPPPENSGTGGGDTKTTPPAGETKTETPPAGETPTETPPAGETPAEPAKAQKVDLSHVKAGQKYVYKMESSGMEMQITYEVLEVTDTAVKYKSATKMKMPGATEFTDAGEPTTMDWSIPAPTGETTGETKTDAKPPEKETISAAGKDWECWKTESSGSTVWTPIKNDLPTFPPMIKMDSPQAKQELVEIKE